jgi:hypothetical protein
MSQGTSYSVKTILWQKKPVMFEFSHYCLHTESMLKIVSSNFHNDGVVVYVRARGSIVVKALCYKLEGRGLETR